MSERVAESFGVGFGGIDPFDLGSEEKAPEKSKAFVEGIGQVGRRLFLGTKVG